MTAIWALTAQAIMVSLGYAAAVVCAGAFVSLVVLNVDIDAFTTGWGRLANLLVFFGGISLEIAIRAFFPFAAVVAVSEGLKLRGVTAYLVAGCVVAFVMRFPIGEALGGASASAMFTRELTLAVAAGAIGGLVYWVVAGRTAGQWLELPWFDPARSR